MELLVHFCTFLFVLHCFKIGNTFAHDEVCCDYGDPLESEQPSEDNPDEDALDRPVGVPASSPPRTTTAIPPKPSVPKKKPIFGDFCKDVKVMNDFGFDLQKHVSNSSAKNMVFSPYSIYGSLALLSLGARGKSKQQILSALKWDGERNHYKLFKKINEDLLPRDSKNVDSILHVANNGWVGADQILSRTFLNESKHYFGIQYQPENFANSKVARNRINKWVSDHTGDRITELFPTGSIDEFTRIVLANAIYFKGHWSQPFEEKNTMPRSFFRSDGEIVLGVDYMVQNGRFNVGVHRNVQLLELPYGKDEKYSMLFAKPQHPSEVWRYKYDPKNFVNIDRLGEALNADLFEEWMKVLEKTNLDILIPKFTLKQRIDLKDKLRSMGVEDVFTSKADLSGISNEKNLYLSSALHKAYIEVDEKGTQATAVTGLSVAFYSATPMVELNRPFFFFIINKRCNSVIFVGKVMDP